MSRPRKYPEELICRGIRMVFESGRPVAHVAADLGLPSETLRKKVRQAEIDEGRRQGLSTAERDEIREAILTRGWSEARQAYAQSFDSDELDAAALLMPILGFLPASDERMRSTIDAIADQLTEDGLVLRYRNQGGLNADGLAGEEGTFVICSFWLVSALAKAGEVDRAEALFDQLVSYANDLGLLAEEIDTSSGELLGNFPQAFSHIGVIFSGVTLAAAGWRS